MLLLLASEQAELIDVDRATARNHKMATFGWQLQLWQQLYGDWKRASSAAEVARMAVRETMSAIACGESPTHPTLTELHVVVSTGQQEGAALDALVAFCQLLAASSPNARLVCRALGSPGCRDRDTRQPRPAGPSGRFST